MKGLSAALSVAGHAGPAGSLALPPVVLTDITGLVKQQSVRDEETETYELLGAALYMNKDHIKP